MAINVHTDRIPLKMQAVAIKWGAKILLKLRFQESTQKETATGS
jgi:hypothetical protein